MQLLKSITFADAKRTFTKDVSMRIDLLKICLFYDTKYLNEKILEINKKYNMELNLDSWDDYLITLSI